MTKDNVDKIVDAVQRNEKYDDVVNDLLKVFDSYKLSILESIALCSLVNNHLLNYTTLEEVENE